MREIGVIAKALGQTQAEREDSQRYIGIARLELGKLKTRMKLGGIENLSRRVVLADGAVILVRSVLGNDFVQITPPARARPIPTRAPAPAPAAARSSWRFAGYFNDGFSAVAAVMRNGAVEILPHGAYYGATALQFCNGGTRIAGYVILNEDWETGACWWDLVGGAWVLTVPSMPVHFPLSFSDDGNVFTYETYGGAPDFINNLEYVYSRGSIAAPYTPPIEVGLYYEYGPELYYEVFGPAGHPRGAFTQTYLGVTTVYTWHYGADYFGSEVAVTTNEFIESRPDLFGSFVASYSFGLREDVDVPVIATKSWSYLLPSYGPDLYTDSWTSLKAESGFEFSNDPTRYNKFTFSYWGNAASPPGGGGPPSTYSFTGYSGLSPPLVYRVSPNGNVWFGIAADTNVFTQYKYAVWSGGGMRALPLPTSTYGFEFTWMMNAVSDDGDAIGSVFTEGQGFAGRALRWPASGGVEDLGGAFATASADCTKAIIDGARLLEFGSAGTTTTVLPSGVNTMSPGGVAWGYSGANFYVLDGGAALPITRPLRGAEQMYAYDVIAG